jgi:tetratricopeptide (TPR) repeat protein
MFEFGRELRRLFGVESALGAPRDGMTGGDAALLELLDLKMLHAEAKAADVAAGRIGEKDKARRLLESAVAWREVARRSGDPTALRKAASTAEAAHLAFDRQRRGEGAARARVEQALCAMLGAELFGDEGLNAAAEKILRGARRGSGAAAGLAAAILAALVGRKALGQGDLVEVRAAARAFNDPIAALESAGRRDHAVRIAAAEARIARAELLEGAGLRLKDEALVRAAIGDLEAAVAKLDPAYEPLTWSRIDTARAGCLVALGELTGDIGMIADAVTALSESLEGQPRDHSPLDWAKGQAALAMALQSLGESGVCEAAFEKAVTCFDRAALALKDAPGLSLRATVASNRAICLARSAELTGDLAVLDAAEAAFKTELAGGAHRRDPVAWALLQTHLGRLYEARLEITGQDRGERAAAALAFSAALDVFGEQGLRSLADLAAQGLERLKAQSVA